LVARRGAAPGARAAAVDGDAHVQHLVPAGVQAAGAESALGDAQRAFEHRAHLVDRVSVRRRRRAAAQPYRAGQSRLRRG